MLGARVGLNDHVTVGEGAQIAAAAACMATCPPGARWGGYPAQPVKTWFREVKALAAACGARRNRATRPPRAADED